MSINFHIENWRKLYRTLPPSWLMLPLSARGLGDEMIKYVDDDGLFAIKKGRAMVEEVCRIMSAHPKERRRVGEDLADLLEDGYLVKTEEGLKIRNFVEAQGASSGAKRTARWRHKREQECDVGDVTRDGGSVTSCDASDVTPCDKDLLQVVTETKRNETKRNKRDALTRGPHVPGDPDPEGDEGSGERPLASSAPGPVDVVFAAYLDGWDRHVGRGIAPVLTDKRRKLIRARIGDHGLDATRDAAAGIWRSAWHRDKGQTSIDLALRDAAHVERFANEPGGGGPVDEVAAPLFNTAHRKSIAQRLIDESIAAMEKPGAQ